MKDILTMLLLAGLATLVPAQGDPDTGRAARDQEIRELKKALEELRNQERALRQRIADLERQDGAPLRRRLPGLDPDRDLPAGPDVLDRDVEAWHEQMEARMREWQRRTNERFRRAFPDFPDFRALPRGLGAGGTGRSMKVESGPDGVRAEVRERGEDGKWQTRTYEAESLEELKKAHPEVFKGVNLRLDFGSGFDFDLRGGLRPPRDDLPVPEPGPRLGVRVRVSEEQDGLIVEEVLAGSLAAQIGVAEKDVILEVNDVVIGDIGDVARGLREGAGKVAVKILRDGKERVLAGTTPRSRRLRRSRDM